MKQYLLLLTLLLLLILPVVAENTTANGGYVIVTMEDTPTINTTSNSTTPEALRVGRRIEQGACVVPGETIDIAGNGWYTGKISYYGRWYDGFTIGGNNTLAASYEIEARNLDKVFLNPAFFAGKLGWWYTYYDVPSRSGNDRQFYLSQSCLPVTKKNETVVQKEMDTMLLMKMAVNNITSLPVKTDESDLLISKESDFTTDAVAGTRRWVFGTTSPDILYDTPVTTGSTTYPKAILQNLPTGTYHTIFIHPGANGIIEELYDPATHVIYSPFRSQPNVSVHGIQPKLVEDILISRINTSIDDTYTLQKISLQSPSIEIKKLEQTTLSNNITILTIVGYTNANVKSTLKLVFDANTTNAKTVAGLTHYSYVTDNGGDGAYRIWYTAFPVDLSDMTAGYHSITAMNQEGAYTVIPYYIRRDLPEHYKPNVYLNYIDSNPFIPTPTPEVIIKTEVKTVEVTVTITIPVTPSQESVDQAEWNAITGWVIIGTIVTVIGAFTLYLFVSFIRGLRRIR